MAKGQNSGGETISAVTQTAGNYKQFFINSGNVPVKLLWGAALRRLLSKAAIQRDNVPK